jgi:putative ABC transport system substrate-binding protein
VKRREFIALLGGAAAAWPQTARAQQPAMLRIGVLEPLATNDDEAQPRVTAFEERLRELGWVNGQNVHIAAPIW